MIRARALKHKEQIKKHKSITLFLKKKKKYNKTRPKINTN